MDWELLAQMLALLITAFALGVVAESFRLSALVGYLLAGTLIGPGGLALFEGREQVEVIAELGVALLLFTIGLEFSIGELRRLGTRILVAGILQIAVTLGVGAGISLLIGVDVRASLVIGSMVALSSTACVLRLLASRQELDSLHGRSALGILLCQDVAVVPLVLLVGVLGSEGAGFAPVWELFRTLGLVVLLSAAFLVLFRFVVPWLLRRTIILRNRELPILLAIVTGLGSTWLAHEIKVSPAMGAFLAGVLLAESPFATQVRADVGSLRTLLTTLFFSSIGLLGDPAWVLANLPAVLAVLAAFVVGKAVIIAIILHLLGTPTRHGVAAAVSLAQVGEFSFVLATIARDQRLLSDQTFQLVLSATIMSLFLAPLLIMQALPIGEVVQRRLGGRGGSAAPSGSEEGEGQASASVVLIGYGPAGEAVGEAVMGRSSRVTVVDLNPVAAAEARQRGFSALVGDASHHDVLDHMHAAPGSLYVITIPDPIAARSIIRLIRLRDPAARIIVRARYHIYVLELQFAGADEVFDEELEIGQRMGHAVQAALPHDRSANEVSGWFNWQVDRDDEPIEYEDLRG